MIKMTRRPEYHRDMDGQSWITAERHGELNSKRAAAVTFMRGGRKVTRPHYHRGPITVSV